MDFINLDKVVVNNINNHNYINIKQKKDYFQERKTVDQFQEDKFTPSNRSASSSQYSTAKKKANQKFNTQQNVNSSHFKSVLMSFMPNLSSAQSFSAQSNKSNKSSSESLLINNPQEFQKIRKIESQFEEIKAFIKQIESRVKKLEHMNDYNRFNAERVERIESSAFKRFSEIEQKILKIEVANQIMNTALKTVRGKEITVENVHNKYSGEDLKISLNSVEDFEEFSSDDENLVSKDQKIGGPNTPHGSLGIVKLKYSGNGEEFENEESKSDASKYLSQTHNRIKSFTQLNTNYHNLNKHPYQDDDPSSFQSTQNQDKLQSLNDIYNKIMELSKEKFMKQEILAYEDECNQVNHNPLRKITEKEEEFSCRSLMNPARSSQQQYLNYYQDIDKMLQRSSVVSSVSKLYKVTNQEDIGDTIQQLEFTLADDEQECVQTLKKPIDSLQNEIILTNHNERNNNYDMTMKADFSMGFEEYPVELPQSRNDDSKPMHSKNNPSISSMVSQQTIKSYHTNKETNTFMPNNQQEFSSMPGQLIQQNKIMQLLNSDIQSNRYAVNGDWLRDYCKYIDIEIESFINIQQPQLIKQNSTEIMQKKLQNLEKQVMINYQIDQNIKQNTLLNTSGTFNHTRQSNQKNGNKFDGNGEFRESQNFFMRNSVHLDNKIINKLLINENGEIKHDLVLNRDYFIVNELIWNQLLQWGFEVDVEIVIKPNQNQEYGL